MIPVTMEHIAQRAGLSRTSIWMALRDHPRVSKATRDRVQKLAMEMGYQSNPLVAAHMSNVRKGRVETSSIGVAYLSTETDEDLERQPFRKILIEETRGRLAILGYRMERFCIDRQGASPRRLERILLARGILGVVFGVWEAPEITLDWRWEHFACVRLDNFAGLPPFHMARTSEPDTLEMAWNHARSLGYRRIGFVVDEITDQRTGYRGRGMYLALQSLIPKKERVPLMLPATGDDWCPERVLRFIREESPDCLLVRNPQVYYWITNAGLRIPEDIGYVGMKSPHAGNVPQVRPDYGQIAARSVDMLDTIMRNNNRGIPEEQVVSITRCHLDPDGSSAAGVCEKTAMSASV